jgi:hypothetical protein
VRECMPVSSMQMGNQGFVIVVIPIDTHTTGGVEIWGL